MQSATILQQILQVVSAGGSHSLRELAQQLNISDELLESMIEQLFRMGYLQPLGVSCAEKCHHCSEANCCSIGSSGRAWALTSRGEEITQR